MSKFIQSLRPSVRRISLPQLQSVSVERLIGYHFPFVIFKDSSRFTVQVLDKKFRPAEILVASSHSFVDKTYYKYKE